MLRFATFFFRAPESDRSTPAGGSLRELTDSELLAVAGGAPRGGWYTADATAAVPQDGWLVVDQACGAPRGGWA